MKVLIDTCVWSRFLRRNRPSGDPAAAELSRLVRGDVVEMIGPIREEILSGAQPSDRFDQLKAYLRFYPNLPLCEEDDELAASYYNRLRSKGLQCSGTDLLICAVAVRRGMSIFTTDTDFTAYARHLPIKLHPVRGAT